MTPPRNERATIQRRKAALRAYTGLAGSPLAVVEREMVNLTTNPILPDPTVFLYDGHTIGLPAVLLMVPKRGRPFKNGTRKKTAAEIKRDQRKREHALREAFLASMAKSGQMLTDENNARRELKQAVEMRDAAIREQKSQSTIDALNEWVLDVHDKFTSFDEGREYDLQQKRANERAMRPSSSRSSYGELIADAPQGMGKLMYGFE